MGREMNEITEPAKGDIRINVDHLEVYTGERWIKPDLRERPHAYGKSCNNQTINYENGICSVCGAKWRVEISHPPYWTFVK
jgi:hypothetical protein